MQNIEKRDKKIEFGDSFGALIDYCMAPSRFILTHSPREAQEVGSPEVLERIVRMERNSDALGSRKSEQLAERIGLATLDVRELANHSLWEALKYVTRLVVDVELATLRAGYLHSNLKLHEALEGQSEIVGADSGLATPGQGAHDGVSSSSFKDLHDLLASHGIVASIIAFTEPSQLRRWIEMCEEPQSLLIAYEANAKFDRAMQELDRSLD